MNKTKPAKQSDPIRSLLRAIPTALGQVAPPPGPVAPIPGSGLSRPRGNRHGYKK